MFAALEGRTPDGFIIRNLEPVIVEALLLGATLPTAGDSNH